MARKDKKTKIRRICAFFASFIVLTSVFAFTCFAQAPQDTINMYDKDTGVYVRYDIYSINNDYHYATFTIDFDVATNGNYPVLDLYCILYDDFFNSDLYVYGDKIACINNFFGEADGSTKYNTTRLLVNFSSNTRSFSKFGSLSLYDIPNQLSSNNFDVSEMSFAFAVAIDNQFYYWQNQIRDLNAEIDTLNDRLESSYNFAYSEGYTQALNDYDAFGEGLFAIFNAPFEFVRNITGFEVFNINLFEILCFFLTIGIGIFLFNKIRRFLPF